jgi:lipopolysaccharide export system protein LptA
MTPTLDATTSRLARRHPSAQVASRLRPLLLAFACLLASPWAWAEKADRTKEMVIEADKTGTWDLQRQVTVWTGNVTFTQGTMIIRADRVEVRELPNGFRAASAIGTPGKQASYRQKRDNVDEFVEGQSDRIEFDGRADTIRFLGMRQLRGSLVANEVTGQQLVWNNTSEQFSVEGGNKTAANPTGRVRAVLSPPPDAATPPAATLPGATSPAAGRPPSAAPTTTPPATPPATPLKPSRNLADPR